MSKKTKKLKTNKKSLVSPRKKNRSIKIISIAVLGLVAGYFFYAGGSRQYPVDFKDIESTNINILKGRENRATLSPALFVGKTARAYDIAKQNRELLDSMYCYCHCKRNIGHRSLLSCFVDQHAAKCDICLNQAFYAQSRFQNGQDIAQVRIDVDKKFWRPFS